MKRNGIFEFETDESGEYCKETCDYFTKHVPSEHEDNIETTAYCLADMSGEACDGLDSVDAFPEVLYKRCQACIDAEAELEHRLCCAPEPQLMALLQQLKEAAEICVNCDAAKEIEGNHKLSCTNSNCAFYLKLVSSFHP
jgi:hypothetical protein